MGYDPGGVEQVRCHVLFDPFGVGIDSPVCTVGYTHGYSHSGPSGGCYDIRHKGLITCGFLLKKAILYF